jgi:hypothetical protein
VRPTRLSDLQLAEAEAAFARLGVRSLSLAVEWFLDTYRPPVTEMRLEAAQDAFEADRRMHVRPVTLRDYKLTLDDFRAAAKATHVHLVKTADVLAFLAARKVGPKRWNNLRGDLHAFFEFCKASPRQWTQENPVATVTKYKLPRGVPAIESAARVRELFAFLETYTGHGTKQHPSGFLVPYFALATFAGLRPSAQEGELWRIGKMKDLSRVVDLTLGVIRLGPEIAKTRDVRQIKVQPNLGSWLAKYPLNKFPLYVANMEKSVGAVRQRFGLGKDVLRHTWISMHVAQFGSIGQAALEAGNSERMTKKHYLNLVSQAEAADFWSIEPSR